MVSRSKLRGKLRPRPVRNHLGKLAPPPRALWHMQFFRGVDFFNPAIHQPRVTIIGAGGIGSWVVQQLVKLGVRHIRVYDPDYVSLHNVGTTPYSIRETGQLKVAALQKFVKPYGAVLTLHPQWYKGGRLPKTDILISAVDSMDARRVAFAAAQKYKIPLYIDGRIGGENLRVYAIRPSIPGDRKIYRSTLVPNSRISPLPCTAQNVIDVSSFTASFITRAVRMWAATGTLTHEVLIKLNPLTVMHSPDIRTWPEPPTPEVLHDAPNHAQAPTPEAPPAHTQAPATA